MILRPTGWRWAVYLKTLREFENALDVVVYNYTGRWREAETFYEKDGRHVQNAG